MLSKLFRSALAVSCAFVIIATPAFAEKMDQDEDDRLGWFSQVRVKLMAKNYGLSEEEAENLFRVLQTEKEKSDEMERELRSLYDELSASLEANASGDELSAKMKAISDKQMAIAKREGETMSEVNGILGPMKTAKWVLSKRGMIDQFKGSVKKARETSDEMEKKAPEKKGYSSSRQGNAGYF